MKEFLQFDDDSRKTSTRYLNRLQSTTTAPSGNGSRTATACVCFFSALAAFGALAFSFAKMLSAC
jgi:hypothetical protein